VALQWLRLVVGLLVGCWALGCLVTPDPKLWKERPDAAVDLPSVEGGADAPGLDVTLDTSHDLLTDGACSATGSPTSCDPAQVSGCLVGSCYVVKYKGPSCVCPEGTAAPGDACGTTTECQPGHACVGTVAPGVCRPTCSTLASDCTSGEVCIEITDWAPWGYCIPAQ